MAHAGRAPRARTNTFLAGAVGLAVLLVLALAVVAGRGARARGALAALEALRAEAGEAVPPRPAPLRPGGGAPPAARPSLGAYAAEVDALLARAQAQGEFGPEPRLAGACRLALEGGKRLRAAAVLDIARRAGGRADAAEAALAVEYLHAASLVIDDLPAFDNDLLRRGRPSVHAAAGPAAAQMAAVALVAAAFQGFARQAAAEADPLRAGLLGTRLAAVAARALGPLGAAGGQLLDSGGGLPAAGVERVAEMKTASFFELAFAAGWLAGKGATPGADLLGAAGRSFGLAFQLADDVGDMRRDAARGAAANYALVHGREAALRAVGAHLAAARRGLEAAGVWGPFWEASAFPAVWAMAAPEPEPALQSNIPPENEPLPASAPESLPMSAPAPPPARPPAPGEAAAGARA